MKSLIVLLGMLLFAPLQAAEGLLTLASPHGVAGTADRLASEVTGAGFKVIARVNHGRAAEKVGIELKPVELLIFGKPKAGSLLMQGQPSVAIDLPMKYLVWEDADGTVRVGWNDPAWIASRHGITGKAGLVKKMQAALRSLATRAVARD